MMKRLTFLGIFLGAAVWCTAATHDVEIINFAFAPATLPINATDSVRWIQRDAPPTPHTSTSADGLWDSGQMVGVGTSFTFTFNNAGTFSYFCGPHPFMQGSVTVSAVNTAPTVSITSPTNGSSFNGPTDITVTATAEDTGGSIAQVEFFNGSTSIGVDPSSPYSATANFALGTHVLTAVARDNLNTASTSAPVSITVTAVNTPPTVSMTSPTNGASFNGPTDITVTATAEDTGGSITQVEFFNGSTSIGVDTSSPYSAIANFTLGTHVLTAVARDNLSTASTSAPVSITVSAINIPPVEITNIVLVGTNIEVVCGGGVGPFALQKKSGLNDPMWINGAFTPNRTSSLPAIGGAAFFRVSDTANQPAIPLTAILSGAAERPNPVDTTATGSGSFALEGNVLRFDIRYSGLSSNSSAAHIHGPANAAGATGVMIDLAPFHGGPFGGTAGTFSGSVVLTPTQKAAVLAGLTYVNVHSAAHQGGEIRGQIAPIMFQTFLSGANERPNSVTNSDGTGSATFALVGNQLTFNISYRNLSGSATAAHIHGPTNENSAAGVMIDLAPFNGGAFGASGNMAGSVTLTATQLAALVDGLTYVNIHTDLNQSGEIRGQIRPQTTAIPFTAILSGANERPDPVTNTTATGSATFSLEGDTLNFDVRYSGLLSNSTASHIHGPASAAQAAGIMIDLGPYHIGPFGSTNGTIAGRLVLTPTQKNALVSGLTYVNVHSAAHGGGEIRGQIAPVLMQTSLSGTNERPNPVISTGSGSGIFTLVRDQLSFNITYRDLPSTATASHIHGPATALQSTNVLIDFARFNGGAYGVSGGLAGTTNLVPSNLAWVIDGLTYFNFHTTNNPPGEIRGQITR
jgi:plastocyanin